GPARPPVARSRRAPAEATAWLVRARSHRRLGTRPRTSGSAPRRTLATRADLARFDSCVVRTFPPPPKAPARLAQASCGREGGRSAVSGEPKGSHYVV